MKSDSPGKPGRPTCDVSDFVFSHVSSRLATGMTLAEVAREGMIFYDHNGKGRKVVRHLKGKHLEAAYRAAERDRMLPSLRAEARPYHAWPTFMERPLPVPFGAALPSEREPGRRKNKSRAR